MKYYHEKKLKNISFDEVTGTGKNRKRFDEVEIDKASEYAAEDADVTLRLHRAMLPKLEADAALLSVYRS
jgi:DNA polymerase-1